MALLNVLVQLVGIGVGVYLMFTRSVASGIALVVVISVGHFLFSKLSNGLMFIHQRRMSIEEQRELIVRTQFGRGSEAVPPAWRAIATGCGAAYFILAVGAIWAFLRQ